MTTRTDSNRCRFGWVPGICIACVCRLNIVSFSSSSAERKFEMRNNHSHTHTQHMDFNICYESKTRRRAEKCQLNMNMAFIWRTSSNFQEISISFRSIFHRPNANVTVSADATPATTAYTHSRTHTHEPATTVKIVKVMLRIVAFTILKLVRIDIWLCMRSRAKFAISKLLLLQF